MRNLDCLRDNDWHKFLLDVQLHAGHDVCCRQILGCHQSLGEEVVAQRSRVAGTGDLKFGPFSLCKTLHPLRMLE